MLESGYIETDTGDVRIIAFDATVRQDVEEIIWYPGLNFRSAGTSRMVGRVIIHPDDALGLTPLGSQVQRIHVAADGINLTIPVSRFSATGIGEIEGVRGKLCDFVANGLQEPVRNPLVIEAERQRREEAATAHARIVARLKAGEDPDE